MNKSSEPTPQAKGTFPAKAIFLAVGLLLLVLLLLAPLSANNRQQAALFDLAHAPLFALAGYFTFRLIRYRERQILSALLIWGLLVGLGVACELIQYYVHRMPSFEDARANALGAAIGILLAFRKQNQVASQRILLALVVALLLLVASWNPVVIILEGIAQQQALPQIDSFESQRTFSRWQFQDIRARRTMKHSTDGRYSLRLALAAANYPSAKLTLPPENWSGYEELLFDVTVGEGEPIQWVLKVADRQHNWSPEDRFEKSFQLRPGLNRLRVSLAEIAAAPHDRTLQLNRVLLVEWFAVAPEKPCVLYLDNIRLQ